MERKKQWKNGIKNLFMCQRRGCRGTKKERKGEGIVEEIWGGKENPESSSGIPFGLPYTPLVLTFPHSPGAGNSDLKQEHHGHPLRKGNHHMWQLPHRLSSYTLVRTCSTYLCEDHNIPLSLNRNFHLDPQQNTT